MGTNYYLYEQPDCPTCGRNDKPLHIGKSSSGWCFGLHVGPEISIDSLDDWIARWSKPGAVIKNEYGETVFSHDMLKIITERGRDTPPKWDFAQYTSNYAVPGPNNLLRHRIADNFCIGHGPGTWDLMVGYFS